MPLPRLASRRAASQCEVCRQWADDTFCADCLARFAAPHPRCRRCALPIGVLGTGFGPGTPPDACGDCLHEPPPFGRTVCALDYVFPWDRAATRLKFNGHPELARPLAALLVNAVRAARVLPREDSSTAPWPDLVLPVPLAEARLRERGFNQAWELARHVAGAFDLPSDATLLERVLDTPHQADLGRAARLRNLAGAFMVHPQRRAALQGRHVALVDDVMTTGATARAAATVLLRAGAAAVDLWVLARTPDRRDTTADTPR